MEKGEFWGTLVTLGPHIGLLALGLNILGDLKVKPVEGRVGGDLSRYNDIEFTSKALIFFRRTDLGISCHCLSPGLIWMLASLGPNSYDL